jgi:predicted alpha-1,2-mannosidase
MIRLALLCVFACTVATLSLAQDPVDYVNTLQGTNSRFELTYGNTYPTCAMPFGMHTWTPQTGRNGDGWKYQYHVDTIRGFQQAHQCSSWSNDYAVFSLMPVVGKLVVHEDERATQFSHDDETAKPHDYRVRLASGVDVAMAPSDHGAWLEFKFPADKPAYVVLDGYTGFAEVKIDAERRRATGIVRNGRNQPQGFVNHYVLEFDQPLKSFGTWRAGRSRTTINADDPVALGRRVGGYFEFAPGSVVNIRVASSYVDLAQAERNLANELAPMTSIEEVRDLARGAWNQMLGKVAVEGGSDEELATFYSCMFRACLFPRKFFEFDAKGNPYYRSPYDGEIHVGTMYTDTGLWDTFRAQMPLNALIQPTMHGEYVAAMLDAYEQCGWLPSWSFPGEAGSMIGNHAISVLTDAWAKDIRTFDPHQALAAYHHEATNKGPWGPANGRGGADEYGRLGYLPYPEHREATAKTLEYAYDDFCGFELARMVGSEPHQAQFAETMFHYKNVYEPTTGFMRGRNSEGEWAEPFDPIEWGGPYTEGCAWHWLWSVFHDVEGLIALVGGEQKFIAKLDAVFDTPGDFKVGTYGGPIHEMREMKLAGMGQYAHGNQPMQHAVYLYCYARQPWKTQARVREVMRRLYNSTENGYPGDEDQGQTSSWYVLSAMGFYTVCPGTDEYVLGSPVFERTTLNLENGKQFVVEARNNSPENVYIQSATLNGDPYAKNYLRHRDIVAGGTLVLEMSSTPNSERGTGDEDKPFSVSTRE